MSSTKNRKERYLFNIEDYKVIRCIKRGGFGVINLIRNKTSGKEYASKTNLIQTGTQNKLLVSREVRILIEIQHDTIIQFRGFSYLDFDGKKNVTILMDYMKNGSLSELIEQEMKSLCPHDYDNTKRQILLAGIARGMMILHQHHIIHRDLKPENILLDDDFRPRITDFGLSKFFDPLHSMNQSKINTGTAAYMAPEVINSDNYNSKADVYAFGIIMYEIISGNRAYVELFKGKNKINEFQLKLKVTQGLRPNLKEGIKNKNLRKLISKCLSENPKERPTFSELFRKLSLTRDEFFLEFEGNDTELTITDDDDDDEEEDVYGEIIDKKYCLDGVNFEELLDYVEEIKSESKSFKEDVNVNVNNDEIDKLKLEIIELKEITKNQSAIISELKTDLKSAKSDAEKYESEVKNMKKTINDQSTKIKKLEANLGSSKISTISQSLSHFFYSELSFTEPGILCRLKEQEKTPFDRLFIASQSSNDIYSLIDPKTNDKFSTNKNENFFIEFEIKDAVMINGIKILSSYKFFPKSFNIEIEGKLMKSIKEAKELNGKNNEMTIKFQPKRSQKIRFVQTGQNWDEDNSFYSIKRIELLSNEPKFSKGVFSSLIEQSENEDPHKCPVKINATSFDFNSFHSIKSKNNIWTFSRENSWFQIELTKGLAILKGFRLKKIKINDLKCFKIICTDNVNNPEEYWIKLIEINDKTTNDHQLIDIYEFPHPSPPTRFIRLIQTGPDFNNKLYIALHHFDLFGYYF